MVGRRTVAFGKTGPNGSDGMVALCKALASSIPVVPWANLFSYGTSGHYSTPLLFRYSELTLGMPWRLRVVSQHAAQAVSPEEIWPCRAKRA